ncbi:MAG: UvrB/UvrC motif-containing protein [Phycisphaerae bacterium]|nr:UvrB/UvrC motif-containing protein [Phycisphaerae bacterium]
MSLDIDHILNGWPFKPGEVNVRRILGEDGREKIQLRLDLGLLQMNTTGRPDGRRPHGFDSLLAYHEHTLEEHTAAHGTQDGFSLDEGVCEELRTEGVMFYHRYLAEFVLGDYESVQRDTRRNLRMFDFCAAYAEEEYDRFICEQYRPYVLMMYARARARSEIRKSRPKRALAVIRRTIGEIKALHERFEQEEPDESSMELSVLRALEREIQSLIPQDPRLRLKKQLRDAIRDERYEDAADIRDRLEKITRGRPHGWEG